MTRQIARLSLLSLAAAFAVAALARQEAWKPAYAAGVKAAQDGKWQESRDQFKRAIADRPEDEVTGGLKPLAIDAKKAPYSANFAAAYAAYRLGLESNPDVARKLFTSAEQELSVLVGKQRAGREVFFTLARIYSLLGRTNDSQAFDTQWKANIPAWVDDSSMMVADDKTALGIADAPAVVKPTNPVTPVVTVPPATGPGKTTGGGGVKPPDVSPVQTEPSTLPKTQTGTTPPLPGGVTPPSSAGGTQPPSPGVPVTSPPVITPNGAGPTMTAPVTTTVKPVPLDERPTHPKTDVPAPIHPEKRKPLDDAGGPPPDVKTQVKKGDKGKSNDNGPVVVVPTKYALVIGNAKTNLSDLAVPFANDSAAVVNDAIIKNAGYDPSHVVFLSDASASQILTAAKGLAAQVPEGGTVFIYFAGVGVNVDGKDYLAGTDAGTALDTSLMVSKSDLFHLFVVKGARTFAFFETHRPRVNDTTFGQEEALVGSIAQSFGTIQGQRILSSTFGGKDIGLYAQGIANVLKEFHSNAVPIQDFAWEVFYSMRRGGQEGTGGGSLQTPTLPVITYMPAEARF